MKIIVYVLAVVSLFSSVWARNWYFQPDGDFLFGYHCDFGGRDLESQPSVAGYKECGKLCRSNKYCTHFTSYNGNCFIKRSSQAFQEIPYANSFCGFIPERTDQSTAAKSL